MGISSSFIVKDNKAEYAVQSSNKLTKTLSPSYLLTLSPRGINSDSSPTKGSGQKGTLHLNNLKDDAESFRSKIEALKLIMKNEIFRLKFVEYLRLTGKSAFFEIYQRLERLRKWLVLLQISLSSTSTQSSYTESTVESSIFPEKSIFEDFESLTIGIPTYCVIHESIEFLQSIQQDLVIGNAPDTTKDKVVTQGMNMAWIRRISRLQEDVLSNIFDEFEQFVDGEEFRTIRRSGAPLSAITLPVVPSIVTSST